MARLLKKQKYCWLAKEYKKGWRLAYCVGNKISYLNYWFANETTVNTVLKSNIVFVHMRGDK